MIPNIVLFGKTITPYMLAALAGVLVILFFTQRIGRKRGLDEIHILYMLLYSFIGVFVGGHILYGITNFSILVQALQSPGSLDSFHAVIQLIATVFGGSVFYGGLIGAVLIIFIYIRCHRLPAGPYTDTVALAIPLFHVFGRIGCFLSGCCYGIEWSRGWTYRYCLIESANGVPRFPVQLVEAGLNLALFFLMYACVRKNKLKDRILALYFSIYPVYRFILEYFRGDEYRGFLGIFSTSQIISIGLLAIVCIYWFATARKVRK